MNGNFILIQDICLFMENIFCTNQLFLFWIYFIYVKDNGFLLLRSKEAVIDQRRGHLGLFYIKDRRTSTLYMRQLVTFCLWHCQKLLIWNVRNYHFIRYQKISKEQKDIKGSKDITISLLTFWEQTLLGMAFQGFKVDSIP